VKALFEGVAALIAVVVLSSMTYWMAARRKELRVEVERRVEAITTRGATLGLVSIAFVAVFREGLETVLFLTATLVTDSVATVAGLFLGTLTSLALTYGILVVGMKINVRRFFYFTSILLVLLAGGLAGYGVHEFIEYTGSASWGWLGQYAYNLNIAKDSLLHHKGIVGSIFAVMFGYTVSAESVRVIIHLFYLCCSHTSYSAGLQEEMIGRQTLNGLSSGTRNHSIFPSQCTSISSSSKIIVNHPDYFPFGKSRRAGQLTMEKDSKAYLSHAHTLLSKVNYGVEIHI